MKQLIALILILMVLVLGGCAPAASEAPSYEEAPAAPASGNDGYAYTGGEMERAAAEPTAASPMGNGERMVIRNANLTIIVEQPGEAMAHIMRMAETMNGYVVSSNLYKTYTENDLEVPEASVTVRVPAERLSDALDQIKALVKDPAQDVKAENVSGQDVTREYSDLNARLVNLEEAEKQMREIMASATKTEDVLAVHQQLTQIRGEIERIKGDMQYYREASALSSISVLIQSEESVQPLEIGGWQPVGVARNAVQAMIDTMQFFGSVAIWLVLYVLPVGLVIFLPIRLLWILIRRGNKKKPAAPTTTPPPPAPQA